MSSKACGSRGARLIVWLGTLLLGLGAGAACTEHSARKEAYGAIEVTENWTKDRLDWEGTHQGIDHWTVSSPAGNMKIAKAWFHPWKTALLVNASGAWEEKKTEDLFLVLDTQTGKMFQADHTTCPTVQTPFGAALTGSLQQLPKAEPVAFLIYRDRANQVPQALCMVEFAPATDRLTAVKLPWPSEFAWPVEIRDLTNSEAIAIGCEEPPGPSKRCALFRMDEKGPRILQTAENVDRGDLAIILNPAGPKFGRRTR